VGVSVAISATISSTSRIVALLKTVGSGAHVPVSCAALDTDRVNGSPGSFKLSALDSGGNIDSAANCTYDWIIL
jgi:hypothetical protein